jgi:hypothetical protein
LNKILTEYFDNSQENLKYGILCEGVNAGKYAFYEMENVKKVYIDDEWVDNPSYNLNNARDAELTTLNQEIIDLSVKKDKADALELTTESASLQTQIDTKNTRKTFLNTL